MRFAYYDRLGARERRIYDASDAIAKVVLPEPVFLSPIVLAIADRLKADDVRGLTLAVQALTDGLCDQLRVGHVTVQVLAARPSRDWGELHGLYERPEDDPPQITVWMRTAQQRRVVAFRTFLRTLLHEVLHHLDYEYLRLADSFHTQGFYKRESSLFVQLVKGLPEAIIGKPRARRRPGSSASE